MRSKRVHHATSSEKASPVSQVVDFVIGAEVNCEDGPCGAIQRLIVDPVTNTITHLVVSADHGPGSAHLVPIELVDATASTLLLHCTTAEFETLEDAETVQSISPRAFGIGSGMGGISEGLPTRTTDNVPTDEAEIQSNDHVHAVDGRIGRIHGVVADVSSYQVTHILLAKGHLWGEKEIAIPISAVTQMSTSIELSLTKAEVEALPSH